MSPAAFAAELGKITVLSAAGQPLRAEIELTAVKPGETPDLLAKLAPPDAYRQASVELNPALNALTFAVENRNGKPFIRISSTQPVAEPMVDLLLELSGKSGRQVREYAFVLDTPEARQTRGPQVAAPAAPGAAGKGKAATEQKTTEYRVKAGDTLSRIATELKPSGVSLDMMLVALYRANPDAFKGENMNRMQAGRILAVPGADAIRATDAAQAKGIVTAHAIDFEAYRNKLAGQVAQSKPVKAAQAGQSTAGKIGATKVQEKPTAASESQDKLKLSKAEPAAKSAGKSTVASDEDKIAKAKQVEEAAARVKELEKNVSDLEKLMAVKNKAMADKSAPAPAKPADAVASASAVASAAASAAASAPAEPPVPKAKPVPLVKAVSPLEPTFVDKIGEHGGAIGIAIAALLAAAAALIVARRKKDAATSRADAEPVFEPELSDAPKPKPEPGLASEVSSEAAPEAVAETASAPASHAGLGVGAVAGGAAAVASATALDGNEVDPVAEADVYIAYGRDGQAEEILKEALRAHPDRHAARLKLLEIYSARNDSAAFEDQASELYSLTQGHGDEWPQAAAMGLALDPSNPLYRGADVDAVVQLSKTPVDGLVGRSMDLPDDEPAPAAAVHDERHALDFDLDSLDFEPVSTTDPIVLPGPGAIPVPAAPTVAEAKEAHKDAEFDASMDFGLDLEPGAGTAPAGLGLTPLPDPLKDVDLADFDLAPADLSASAPAAPLEPLPAVPKHTETIPTAQEFDLSGIDLDLNDGKAAAPGVEDPLSAIHMEMDTKLDLAIAYQEIGDKEGARELIDEVIKGGSTEQVAKANTMRALLG